MSRDHDVNNYVDGTVLWRSSITIAHTRAPSQNVSVTFT